MNNKEFWLDVIKRAGLNDKRLWIATIIMIVVGTIIMTAIGVLILSLVLS